MERSAMWSGVAGILSTAAIGPQLVDVIEWIIQIKYGVVVPPKVLVALVGLINVAIMILVFIKTKDKPVKLNGGVQATVDAKPRDKILTEQERAELRAKLGIPQPVASPPPAKPRGGQV